MKKKKADIEKERKELLNALEASAEHWLKYADDIKKEGFDEVTIKRLEHVASQGLKFHKVIEKVYYGRDLTSDEINLYLDSLGDDFDMDKYIDPPDDL